MNYALNKKDNEQPKSTLITAVTRLIPLMRGEGKNVVIALVAILISSATTLAAPVIISHTVDTFIVTHDFHGVLVWSALLLVVYLIGLGTSYVQTITMGGVGRRVLFNLRNTLFTKLQELPIAFFNQNKAGDLISRINNDTDKLNQFFAQALMQFLGNAFLIIGAGVLLVTLDPRLGLAALVPALGVLIVTQMISGWVQRANLKSLQSLGGLSAEVQESIENFKVIVAFNRVDYFRQKFGEANDRNYKASINAGIANNTYTPLYGLAYNLAQLITLGYGIYLISTAGLTVGLLIGFLLYVTNFYNPLRQLASVWSSWQLALAGLDRISEVLALTSDMPKMTEGAMDAKNTEAVMEFAHVGFTYPEGKEVLRDVNFVLGKGKTYALVGPTGGGKTTTASLMARLYDPTKGIVYLNGKDMKSYEPAERAQKIGFILQEPFLFSGTVRDNIVYGNDTYQEHTDAQLREVLEQKGLSNLLARFEGGLETKVATSGDSISLGQKQLIAFMRAALREPDILILDEATANIDTVTEQLLEEILHKFPASITKVIIAHRLNTIAAADEIFFVNGGEVTAAGSLDNAVDMLLHGKRKS